MKKLSRVAIFPIAALLPALGIYFVFDLYLSSVGMELFLSWQHSQAVELQEGNLLSSITKNQRMLLSSRFVTGLALFDQSAKPAMRLIEIGERVELIREDAIPVDSPRIMEAGFLKKQILFRPSQRQETLLVFDIESAFLRNLFLATSFFLILFFAIFLASIRALEKRESLRRETFLKEALRGFVSSDQPSELIESEFPALYAWWLKQKNEVELAREQEARNQKRIMLGELGARLAHDIRSPLNSISSVCESLNGIPPATHLLLRKSIERIREIAFGVADQNRALLQAAIPAASFSPQGEVLLSPLLEEVVEEKRIQIVGGARELLLEISPEARFSCAKVDGLEFRRAAANLLNNAFEAIPGAGLVLVRLKANQERIVLEIEDNGSGIPAEILGRIGEKGFTRGRKNGSGLGVYYAKQAVAGWNGNLTLESRPGATLVKMELPRLPAEWLKTELVIPSRGTLIELDDDSEVHALLQARLRELQLPPGLQVEHFFSAAELKSWHRAKRGKEGEYLLLSDLYLHQQGPDGLELIEELSLAGKSVLVTSAYGEASVRDRARALQVSILPKPLLAHVPIRFL